MLSKTEAQQILNESKQMLVNKEWSAKLTNSNYYGDGDGSYITPGLVPHDTTRRIGWPPYQEPQPAIDLEGIQKILENSANAQLKEIQEKIAEEKAILEQIQAQKALVAKAIAEEMIALKAERDKLLAAIKELQDQLGFLISQEDTYEPRA